MSRQLVATYDYPNPTGQPRIRKLRFEPKAFKMQSASPVRTDGTVHWYGRIVDDRYLWGLRALYRLPDVITAIKLQQHVWLCEGEKDADAINAVVSGLGFATSHWQGADDFWPGQAEWFTKFGSRSVVTIICDNDAAGAWSGWLRYTTLRQVGMPRRRLRVIAPPWDGRRLKDAHNAIAEAHLPLSAMRRVRLGSLKAAANRYRAARDAQGRDRYGYPTPNTNRVRS